VYPFGARHSCAKQALTEECGLRRRLGMARALEIAGLPLEGSHHRGEDGTWNIAALVPDLAGRGGRPGDAMCPAPSSW
jgi:inhibitor of KinA sporulation pathway (predicted exonuclease)